MIRPINYPPGTPGRGAALVKAKNGERALIINAMGRIFMDAVDDPFAAIDRELTACPLGKGADAVIVDIHAEATSEKQAMGFFCDGRASLVVGTHTHAPTADYRVLPGGTAFISDVGMTGDYDLVDRRRLRARAAQPLSAQDSFRSLRARFRTRDAVRRCGRNRLGERVRRAHWRGADRRPPGPGGAGVLGCVTSSGLTFIFAPRDIIRPSSRANGPGRSRAVR